MEAVDLRSGSSLLSLVILYKTIAKYKQFIIKIILTQWKIISQGYSSHFTSQSGSAHVLVDCSPVNGIQKLSERQKTLPGF